MKAKFSSTNCIASLVCCRVRPGIISCPMSIPCTSRLNSFPDSIGGPIAAFDDGVIASISSSVSDLFVLFSSSELVVVVSSSSISSKPLMC